ncbi:hypothetical protein GCM10027275_18460 [Rhabdobacter roseus]|uniref:Transposase (putative) YhgA-like domain-containing protein n=1 Tax=Rhabdobacter roseus TaxID=1655419 RepID=A0A840TVU0_9BACT|nr:hypothetical protein [Rhabdobacter roseus]MBB5283769.1 hypothetical protein [Rhabdobacter roseus]
MRRKNDILLKGAFEQTFPDLLRFFFKEADALFDLERGFEFMDKELRELFPELEKRGGTRFVDLLVKTWLRNGQAEWILVHVEIEGGDTPTFPKRMFRYYYRLLDRFEVEVAAIAVFTGAKSQQRPAHYHTDFLGTSVSYRYNAYHIFDHTEQELLAMNNPFALVVLAAQKAQLMGKVPDEELSEQRLTIVRALPASKRYDKEQISHFISFLGAFVHVKNPEVNSKFEKEIERLTGIKNAMGIIEAIKKAEREEGMEQKSYEVVRNLLLAQKFTVAEIANFASVSVPFVKKVEKELKQK